MNNLKLIDHPALQHKLTLLRSKSTNPVQFQQIVEDLSVHLAYEASYDLHLEQGVIKTPIRETEAPQIKTWPFLIAIMRSGITMVGPVQRFLPMAKIGHIGIYRDSSMKSTVEYFLKIPQDLPGCPVFILDILIGTGDTANAVISRLKALGATDIRFLCLLASKNGLTAVSKAHPEVMFYTVGYGDDLTGDGFLDPGIGDAAERCFNCN